MTTAGDHLAGVARGSSPTYTQTSAHRRRDVAQTGTACLADAWCCWQLQAQSRFPGACSAFVVT
jgi:hypothetical protein